MTTMDRSLRLVRSLVSLSAVLVLAAAPLRAQGPSAPSSETVDASTPDSVVVAGPTLGSATVGVRHVDPAATAAKAAPAAPRAGGRSHGEALMIVGGAAILTGIVVGNNAGYAISIAGAVIGLYGLYEYLQ
jgi:hypothetical protein